MNIFVYYKNLFLAQYEPNKGILIPFFLFIIFPKNNYVILIFLFCDPNAPLEALFCLAYGYLTIGVPP